MSSIVSVPAKSDAHPSLDAMRHSCAHLLAAAVQALYPGSRFGTGPATEDGFFYDIETPAPLLEADLQSIEKMMLKLQKRRHPLVGELWPAEKVRAWMEERGQVYKLDLIDRLDAPELGVYRLGDFMDL